MFLYYQDKAKQSFGHAQTAIIELTNTLKKRKRYRCPLASLAHLRFRFGGASWSRQIVKQRPASTLFLASLGPPLASLGVSLARVVGRAQFSVSGSGQKTLPGLVSTVPNIKNWFQQRPE